MTATNIGIKLSVSGDAQVKGALSSVESSLQSVGTAVKAAIGPMALLFAAVEGVGKLVTVQREFDVLNSSLKTVTGSSAAAAREMEWLKQFAKETPFGLAQATQGFVKMKALGLDPSRAALTSFGNTAAAMGKDLNQMIEAVADASTGEFERLKEFGVKSKVQGDQVSFTFQGVTKTIGNNAAEISGYLEAIGNNQFAGAMAERANTLDGAIASLGDTWDELFRTISAQNAGTLMHDAVRMAEGAVTDLTTILTALNGTTADNASQTGAMATVQEGLATAFESVAVLGANVKYVLVQIGNELGGLAAQAVAVATGEFAQAAAIGKMMKADAEKARADVDATSARILNARQAAAAASTRAAEINATATARLARQGAVTWAAEAAKAAADAAKQEAARIKAGEAAGKEAKKAAEAELDWRRKTTLDMVKLWDDQAEAAQKARDAAAKAAVQYYGTLQKELEALEAKSEALRLEGQQIGLSTEALLQLTISRLDDAIATEEQAMAMASLHEASTEDLAIMRKRISLLKEQRNLTAENGAKLAAVEAGNNAEKAADDAEKAWQKASEDIEKSLTDALMRGFESGKGFAEVLRDTIVNMFKTLVLRPIIQATVQGGLNAVGLGGAGGGGLMGTIGAASNLYSAYGAAGAAGGFVGSLGSAATYGTSIGSQQGAMLAAQEIGMGTTAGGMASIGAAAPWLLGGLALVSLIKSLDDSGTYHTGGLGSYSRKDGVSTGNAVKDQGFTFGLASKDYTASGAQASAVIAQSVAGMLDSTAESFGGKAGFYAATAFADDISPDSAWGGLLIKDQGGKTVVDWKDGEDKWPGREFANGEAGAKEYAAAVAVDVRDYLITQTPDWADSMLQALGDAPSLEQLSATVAEINKTQAALESMGKAMPQIATLSDAATAELLKAAGGIDSLAGAAGAYYEGFYSQSEKSALSLQTLTEAFDEQNLALPDTIKGYRELVEAQDLNTEAGRANYLMLMEMAPAYKRLADEGAAYMQVLDSAAKKYLNPDQFKAFTYERASIKLKDLGFDFSADILSATDTASIKAWIVELARTGAVSADTLASLVALADGLIDVKGGADAASASVSSATGGGSYIVGSSSSGGVENPDIAWLRDSLRTLAEETRDALKQIADGLVDSTRNAYQEVDYQASLKAEAAGLDGRRSQISGLQGSIADQQSRAAAIDAALNTGDADAMRAFLASQGWAIDPEASAGELQTILQQLSYSANSSVLMMQRTLAGLTTDFESLDQAIKAWTLAQKRLVARQEIKTLKGEIDSAYEQIDALKTGNDPYQYLAAKVAKKYADYDAGLGADLKAEVSRLQGQADPYTAALTDGIVTESEAASLGMTTGPGMGIADYTGAAIEALALLNGEIGTLTGESEDMLRMIAEWGEAQEALLNAQRRKEIQDMLDGDIKALYGTVDSTSGMQAKAAQQYIDSTIASLRAGGDLPDPTKLREAVDALKTGLGKTIYTSQFEEDRAKLILAGQLGQIKQLTIEELTLDISQQQLTTLVSINDNIEALAEAMASASSAPTVASTPSASLSFAPVQSLMADNQRRDQALVAEIRALREENRAQAESLAALNLRLVKLHEQWDGNGLPEVRDVA